MSEEIQYYTTKYKEGYITWGELREMVEITEAGWDTVPFWISEYYVARINGMNRSEAEAMYL